MKHAYVTIPEGPHYRRDAFAAGLAANGFSVSFGNVGDRQGRVGGGDLLVTWNMHRRQETLAATYQAAGARVICCENGYIGADPEGHPLYAMALDSHNGSGRWPAPLDMPRWPALGIVDAGAVDPDRAGYVLVAAQRGIGSTAMRSPANWLPRAKLAARALFPGVELRVRLHPGRARPERSLEADLADARAVLIWSSAVGVRALVSGVPVVYDAPRWIGEAAACKLDTTSPRVTYPDGRAYRRALEQIAWAQWSLSEIAQGLPFAYLLSHDRATRLRRRPEPAQA